MKGLKFFSMVMAAAMLLSQPAFAAESAEDSSFYQAEAEAGDAEDHGTEYAASEAEDAVGGTESAVSETEDAASEAEDAVSGTESAASEAEDAENAGGDERALPAIGDVIHNFQVEEIRPYRQIDADVVLFTHEPTGAKLMYIANDDTNRTFDLTFRTNAIDDTELPHVFEHATLDGSEKYPSKQLFFNLIYQTYNTFINAFTMDRITSYPIASLSEAQLLKYADYYTDACFHPMIMEDESIFREEAWRYRMNSEDDPLTIEGTVYSEMLGAMSLETQAQYNFRADAFPGSWIRFNEGGNPDAIPEMTYESLKDYHNLYYHPSNCIAFLYGDFENYEAFLELLDGVFSEYEAEEFTLTDDEYVPLTESVENTWTFGVEANSDTSRMSTAYFSYILPGLTDEEEMIQLELLAEIFGAESSALSQAFQTALPYASFYCGLEPASPDPALCFIANNIDEEDAQTFKALVEEAVAGVISEGIPAELADAVMSSSLLSSRLLRESTNIGAMTVAPQIGYYYSISGDPWYAINAADAEEHIVEWSEDGTFTALAEKWLSSGAVTVLSTTIPEAGGKEKKDAALAEKLAEIKASMTDEEIAQIVADSNAVDEAEDTTPYIRELQAVTVDTLPEELPIYEITEETDEQGVRHIEVPAEANEVGIVELFFDASGLSIDDLKWMRLLTELQGYMDSTEHTRQELASLQDRYFYSGSVSYSLVPEDNDTKAHPYYTVSWISLDYDLAAGYELGYELAFEMALDSGHTSQLRDAVQGILATTKTMMTQAPFNTLVYKGLAQSGELYGLYDAIGGVNYYKFLQQIDEELDSDPSAVLDELTRVRALLASRAGAIAAYAGDEDSFNTNREAAAAFMEKLSDTALERVDYSFDEQPDSYALIVDSAVNYNGFAAGFDQLGLTEYEGEMAVVTSVITDQFLYPLLRDQYGAYGVFNSAVEGTGIYMLSYRDPNLTETFDVFDSLPDMIRSYTPDQDTIDGYILSSYSSVAMPMGELSGALTAINGHLSGREQERKLEWMASIKQVTPETLMKYADVYEALVENGTRLSAGGASVIRANSELFEQIDAPFSTGSADAAGDVESVAEEAFAGEGSEFAASGETFAEADASSGTTEETFTEADAA